MDQAISALKLVSLEMFITCIFLGSSWTSCIENASIFEILDEPLIAILETI